MAVISKDGGSGGGGGGLSGWLQRVRKTGEYSDVQVVVNGVEFRLHMLPLMNASSYFRNLPSSSSSSELPKHHVQQQQQQQEAHGAAVCPRVVNIPELPGTRVVSLSICENLRVNNSWNRKISSVKL